MGRFTTESQVGRSLAVSLVRTTTTIVRRNAMGVEIQQVCGYAVCQLTLLSNYGNLINVAPATVRVARPSMVCQIYRATDDK